MPKLRPVVKLQDLPEVKPLTAGQSRVFSSWKEADNLTIYGSAGTGKSYLSVYLALRELYRGKVERVVLVRSAVQTRDIGHLPGTAEEKAAIYEQPYVDIVTELTGQPMRYDQLVRDGQLEFTTTSFLRSITWTGSIIVVDEAQNMTFHELNSVMTRVGEGSRVLVCGDMAQSDLTKNEKSGFGRFLQVVTRIPQFLSIQLSRNDIVRSAFVKAWIVACEDTN